MNWQEVAKARWAAKRDLWVEGRGRFALVTRCKHFRVQLFDEREIAEEMLFQYMLSGCIPSCCPVRRGRNHFIVDLANYENGVGMNGGITSSLHGER